MPLVAIFLGWRGGMGDARAGRPPYLYGLLAGGVDRKELLRSGLATIRDLIAVGIVLDAVAQLLIYGEVHPAAALVVGGYSSVSPTPWRAPSPTGWRT